MLRLLSRLAWGCICVVVWPVYYLAWIARAIFIFPGFWPLPKRMACYSDMLQLFGSPPFLDRLKDRSHVA